MKFNKHNWNVEDIIKARVDLEAEVEHANDSRPPLPHFKPAEVVKNKPGWVNFFLNCIVQLLP